jgi:hypothetical protein
MAIDICRRRIVHCCAPQAPVREGKSAWLDDVYRHAETSRQALDRADISGNIRLKKSNTHALRLGHLA